VDVVLFLEYNNPDVSGISSRKLFEYLYIAKEIIAIGIDGNTVAGKLIGDAGRIFDFLYSEECRQYR
jgi:hypothetical protein